MLDPKRLLADFLGGKSGSLGSLTSSLGGLGQGAPQGGGMMKGALAGGLVTLLLNSKKTRKLGGGMLGYGGAAVVGALAFRAWQSWQAGQNPSVVQTRSASELSAPPRGSIFDLEHEPASGTDARLAVVRAMIAAAKADGHIDAAERQRISEQVEPLNLDEEEKAFLREEIAKPLDLAAVAGLARSKEEAAEIWLASRLTIDPDDFREKAYLDALATKLALPKELVQHLEVQAQSALAEA